MEKKQPIVDIYKFIYLKKKKKSKNKTKQNKKNFS